MAGRSSLRKKCLFCGRFFIADRRVRKRQKACLREGCRKARKQNAQREWVGKNPGYFKGRYAYVKEWRQKKRLATLAQKEGVIQDKTRPFQPCQKLILLIPGEKGAMIQDKIVLQRLTGRTFAACG